MSSEKDAFQRDENPSLILYAKRLIMMLFMLVSVFFFHFPPTARAGYFPQWGTSTRLFLGLKLAMWAFLGLQIFWWTFFGQKDFGRSFFRPDKKHVYLRVLHFMSKNCIRSSLLQTPETQKNCFQCGRSEAGRIKIFSPDYLPRGFRR